MKSLQPSYQPAHYDMDLWWMFWYATQMPEERKTYVPSCCDYLPPPQKKQKTVPNCQPSSEIALAKENSPKAMPPSSSSRHLVTCKGQDPRPATKGHPRPRACPGVSGALRRDYMAARRLPLPSLLLSLLLHGSLPQELSLINFLPATLPQSRCPGTCVSLLPYKVPQT